MESLIRSERSETSILVRYTLLYMHFPPKHFFLSLLILLEFKQEVNNIDGRWCIRTDSGQKTSFKGLLLSRFIKFLNIALIIHWWHKLPSLIYSNFFGSSSGVGSTIEPLSAVPLNDELQRARSLVAKAEADVLLALTRKVTT